MAELLILTDDDVGGHQAVATALSYHAGWEISRQLVYRWWKRRERNGFPEGWNRATAQGGVRQWRYGDVRTWFDTRTDTNGTEWHARGWPHPRKGD